jgi:hypothetical protein
MIVYLLYFAFFLFFVTFVCALFAIPDCIRLLKENSFSLKLLFGNIHDMAIARRVDTPIEKRNLWLFIHIFIFSFIAIFLCIFIGLLSVFIM